MVRVTDRAAYTFSRIGNGRTIHVSRIAIMKSPYVGTMCRHVNNHHVHYIGPIQVDTVDESRICKKCAAYTRKA